MKGKRSKHGGHPGPGPVKQGAAARVGASQLGDDDEVPEPPGAIQIDGSMLEGGGQILRNSAALAAITRQPICVSRIRAGRKNPGLSPQHLTGLRLVEEMCGGTLVGGKQRSTRVAFAPGRLLCGRYSADTGTAGSCTLMVQQALPCMLFASEPLPQAGAPVTPAAAPNGDEAGAAGPRGPSVAAGPGGRAPEAADLLQPRWSQLDLGGGTDASFAPPIGYLEHVLAPTLRRQLPADVGSGLEVRVLRRGFYPRGGGRVVARARALAPGEALPPLDLTKRGTLTQIRVMAFSAGRVPQSDAQRMATAAAEVLQDALRQRGMAVARGAAVAIPPDTQPSDGTIGGGCSGAAASSGSREGSSGSGTGSGGVSIVQDVTREGDATASGDGGGLLLVAESDSGLLWGSSALWERGVPPGSCGRTVAEELLEALESGSCVDQWMQDQLILFMAAAKGTSRMLCGEPTLHARTAMVVAEALLPGARFTIRGVTGGTAGSGGDGPGPGQLHLVECQGAGGVSA